MSGLRGRTVVVTGASRGIGRAIALRCAKDGAHVVVAAKTSDPHPKLPGTIHEVAREVEEAGGRALAVQVDVRDGEQVDRMVAQAVEAFGGIDALVNNAGAIALLPVEDLSLKLYDRMMDVNVRAAFACSHACIPHLKKSPNPHILSLSPPVDVDARWLASHAVYTISKFGMTLLMLGMAEELRAAGIGVNSLWPRTLIATAAVEMLGGEEWVKASRKPEIVADAAHAVLTSPAREVTGNAFLDEDVLRARGVTDFGCYAVDPAAELMPDLYVAD